MTIPAMYIAGHQVRTILLQILEELILHQHQPGVVQLIPLRHPHQAGAADLIPLHPVQVVVAADHSEAEDPRVEEADAQVEEEDNAVLIASNIAKLQIKKEHFGEDNVFSNAPY